MKRLWKETKGYIKADLSPFSYKNHKMLGILAFLTRDINYYRIKFCVHLRKLEYYYDKPLFFLQKWWHKYKKTELEECIRGKFLATAVMRDCTCGMQM